MKLKKIEETINHDVKAIEYYLKEKIDSPFLKEFIHFGLTSQDINSSANILMIKESIRDCLRPQMSRLIETLQTYAEQWKSIPLLAKTHGQPASPTYFGKEFMVYVERLNNQIAILDNINYRTKFGGATGNFNALVVAFPNIDWIGFSNTFIESLGLERHQYTTQIDHYDNYAEVFDSLRRINIILMDLCQDIWLYISRNILSQKINKHEVGSSTMPHKINPINFENAEGNLHVANALLEMFSRKLPISRMQRDLTDSTVLRNVELLLLIA